MFKDFITWLYAKYVVAPEFEAYLKQTHPGEKLYSELRAYNDEINVAMVEKRFAPRVDH